MLSRRTVSTLALSKPVDSFTNRTDHAHKEIASMTAKKKTTKRTCAKEVPSAKSLGYVQGKNLKSTMLRVDVAFAEFVRSHAQANNISVTEATRSILQMIS